LHFTSALAF